jgi:carboxypeptidase family protein
MALSLTMFVEGLAAQGIFGRISGTVTDSQGGAVAGAKISIVNQETNLERAAVTDANGYYVASDLPVGSGNFGGVGGAVNPRNVQFGMKFNF